MNTEKTESTRQSTRKREELRYVTCCECGTDWNVSKHKNVQESRYICPRCWAKRTTK